MCEDFLYFWRKVSDENVFINWDEHFTAYIKCFYQKQDSNLCTSETEILEL